MDFHFNIDQNFPLSCQFKTIAQRMKIKRKSNYVFNRLEKTNHALKQ